MLEFLLFVLVAVLLIRWLLIRNRLTDIERRLDELTTEVRWTKTAAVPPSNPSAEPAPAEPQAALPEPVVPPAVAPEPAPPRRESVPVGPPYGLPISTPAPSLGDRLKALVGNDEWEAVVGASLLNKIGALVLVVGIALFLAYSFAHMTPSTRTLTAFLLSGALLGGGVWMERRQTYRVFSRGLIGAGWAGLYSTAYAMYALPAARIIEDPILGSLLPLAVAAAMVAHSLRYRVQAITAVAYSAAFAALAVTPVTPFGVVALIPLAATLLYLAWECGWHGMAVFGLVATYGTCMAHGSSNAPVAATETLFAAYWVLFELFDLLRIRRRDRSTAAAFLFPLNAIGFLGLSYLLWSSRAPAELWLMSAIASVLYLAGALVRARLRGDYRAALTLAGFLTGLAIVGKVSGVWMAIGLGIEAEILYLAGVRFNAGFVRALGYAGFIGSLFRLLLIDATAGQHALWFGQSIRPWTPPVLFHAALFYLNRYLRRPAIVFSWAASALIALAIAAEVQPRFIGTAWLALAIILFELGVAKALAEFRRQAYCLMAASAGLLAFGSLALGWQRPWTSVAVELAVAYGYALRSAALARGRIDAREGAWLSWSGCWATLCLGLTLLYKVVPSDYYGLAFWVFTLALFEAGVRRLPEPLRKVSWAAAGAAGTAVFLSQAPGFGKFPPQPVWISYFGAAVAAWLLALRAGWVRDAMRPYAAALGTVFTLAGIWLVSPRSVVPIGWSAVALLLLVLARRWALRDLSVGSYVVAGLSFLHVWTVNLPLAEARIPAAALVAALLYTAQFCAGRRSRSRSYFSTLATLIVAGLLWQESSGSYLTVAWGIQGLALLGIGFAASERTLRLAGLALLLFCIAKLFLYDLRHLESLYRILSFVALGLILLAVSWIYARFRDTLRRGLFEQ